MFKTKLRILQVVPVVIALSGQILANLSFSGPIFGKKVRSLSFRTKMGDFWQRHLGGMSGVLLHIQLHLPQKATEFQNIPRAPDHE